MEFSQLLLWLPPCGLLAEAGSNSTAELPWGGAIFMIVGIGLGWLIIAVVLEAHKARIHRESAQRMAQFRERLARFEAGEATPEDLAELQRAKAYLNPIVADDTEDDSHAKQSGIDTVTLLGLGYMSKKDK